MRVCVVHWKPEESGSLLEQVREAGFEAVYGGPHGKDVDRVLREYAPDAILIDLSRLPSHGYHYAALLRERKWTRHFPIVFTGGDPEKVKSLKREIPDAEFVSRGREAAALKRAVKNKPAEYAKPRPMLQRWTDKSTAGKLGVKTGARVLLVDPPRNYAQVLGPLPDEVELLETQDPADQNADVVLWFFHDCDGFLASVRQLRRAADRKFWICWKKRAAGGDPNLTEIVIRENAIAIGLVDYKVCAVNATWSGMAFGRKRA